MCAETIFSCFLFAGTYIELSHTYGEGDLRGRAENKGYRKEVVSPFNIIEEGV